MKVIAKTTGPFELVDLFSQETLRHDRPAVVKWSSFFEAHVGAGRAEILLGQLPEEANDADFAEYWQENPEVAVDAYATSFAPPETPSTPKTRVTKAKAEAKVEEPEPTPAAAVEDKPEPTEA